jgi:hypothetical protein
VPTHLVDERQKLGLGVALARPFGLLTVVLWTASGSARMSVEIAEATKSVAAGGVSCTHRLLPLGQRAHEDDDEGHVAVLHRIELCKVDRFGMCDELVERAVDAERSETRRVRVDDCIRERNER